MAGSQGACGLAAVHPGPAPHSQLSAGPLRPGESLGSCVLSQGRTPYALGFEPSPTTALRCLPSLPELLSVCVAIYL